jgi:hypothetical protein
MTGSLTRLDRAGQIPSHGKRRKNMECAARDISIVNQGYVDDYLPFESRCEEEQRSYQPMLEEHTALIDNLIKLREGMLFHHVAALIGHPDKVECLGEGRWFLTYSLPEKSELRIVLGPGLIWARLMVSEIEIKVIA